MRILKGYSEEERKELEEAKNNHFGSAIDLIRGIVMGNNDCMYLAGKYAAENPGKDNQLARDIADYYAGVAKFAKPKKYYVQLIRNNEGSYLNRNVLNGFYTTSGCQPDDVFQTEFTEQEIRAIDPRYMSFIVPAEED